MGEEKRFKIVGPINNPEFMGMLNEEIKALADKLNIIGITSQSLWQYLYHSIQSYNVQLNLGGIPTTELWAVMDGDKVVAFAHWFVMGEPYNGTTFCDYIYSWNTSKIPTQLLVDKWEAFGKKHSCPWYQATVINERVFTVFNKIAKKRNYEITRHDTVSFVGRKNNG
jgi:hypothetical protein